MRGFLRGCKRLEILDRAVLVQPGPIERKRTHSPPMRRARLRPHIVPHAITPEPPLLQHRPNRAWPIVFLVNMHPLETLGAGIGRVVLPVGHHNISGEKRSCFAGSIRSSRHVLDINRFILRFFLFFFPSKLPRVDPVQPVLAVPNAEAAAKQLRKVVFEYINGGQVPDYIVSHGRLRKPVARKIAQEQRRAPTQVIQYRDNNRTNS
ncbi:hypothetical protein EDB84DRAFT_1434997 [Lactarius hengduanensis]|nr:hypothetical protein EDB84DRAFT_1434997 [Lactarius hengduanensis]